MAHVVFNNVVTKHYTNGLAIGKMLRQTQSLRDTALAFLVGIVDVFQPEVTPIAQQPQKLSCVFSTCNEKDLPDSRVDEGSNGIIHHRLVIDRKQMLVSYSRERIKPAAGSASQDYTFHQAPVHQYRFIFSLISCHSGTAKETVSAFTGPAFSERRQ